MVPLCLFLVVMNGRVDGRRIHIGLSLLILLVSIGGKAKELQLTLLYFGLAVLNCLNVWVLGKLGWLLAGDQPRHGRGS
jgi:hypothetical protein